MEPSKSATIALATVTVKTVSGRSVQIPHPEASYHNLQRVAMKELKLEQEGLKLILQGKQLTHRGGNVDVHHPDVTPGATIVAIGVRAEVRTPSTARSATRPSGVASNSNSLHASPAGVGMVGRSPTSAQAFVTTPPPGVTTTGPLCYPHAPEGLKGLAQSVSECQSDTHRYAALQQHATMAEIRKLTSNGKDHEVLKQIMVQAQSCCPEFVEMCQDHKQLVVDSVNGVTDRGLSVQEMMEAFAVALDDHAAVEGGNWENGDETLINVVQQLFQPGGAGGTASSPIEEFLVPQFTLPPGGSAGSTGAGGAGAVRGDVINAATTEEEEAQIFSSLQDELENVEASKDGLAIASVYSRVAMFHQRRYTVHSESWTPEEEEENQNETMESYRAACAYSVKIVEKRALEQLQGNFQRGPNQNTLDQAPNQTPRRENGSVGEALSTPTQQQQQAEGSNNNGASTGGQASTAGGQTTVSRPDPNVPQSLEDEFYADILASFIHGVFQPAITYFTQASERKDKHTNNSTERGQKKKAQYLRKSLECLLQYSYAVCQVLVPQGLTTTTDAPTTATTPAEQKKTAIRIETPDFTKQSEQLMEYAMATKTHLVVYSPVDVGSVTSENAAQFMGTIGAWVITPFTTAGASTDDDKTASTTPQLHFVSCPCILDQYNAAATTLFHPSFNAQDTWTSKAQEVYKLMVQPLRPLLAPELSGAPLAALHSTVVPGNTSSSQTGAPSPPSEHTGMTPEATGRTNSELMAVTPSTGVVGNSPQFSATSPGDTNTREAGADSHVPIVHFVTPSVFEFSAFPLASLVDSEGQPLVATCAVQQSLSLESVLQSAAAVTAMTESQGKVEQERSAEDICETAASFISTTVAVEGAERPAWLSHNLKKMLNATVQRDQPYSAPHSPHSPASGTPSKFRSSSLITIGTPGEQRPSEEADPNNDSSLTPSTILLGQHRVHRDDTQTILHTSNPGSLREVQQATVLLSEEFHPNLLRPEATDAFNYLLTRFAVQGNTVPSQQCYEVIRGFYVGLSYGLPLSVALRRGMLESHKQHPTEPWRWGRWMLLVNRETAGSRQELRFLARRCRGIRKNVHEVRKRESTRATVRGSREFRYLSSHGVGHLFESMLQQLLQPQVHSQPEEDHHEGGGNKSKDSEQVAQPQPRRAESQDEVLTSLIQFLESNQDRLTAECAAALSASEAEGGVEGQTNGDATLNSHSTPQK